MLPSLTLLCPATLLRQLTRYPVPPQLPLAGPQSDAERQTLPLNPQFCAFSLQDVCGTGVEEQYQQPLRKPTAWRGFSSALYSGTVRFGGAFYPASKPCSTAGQSDTPSNLLFGICDDDGRYSTARYSAKIATCNGYDDAQVLSRLRVGWFSPRFSFDELPATIPLGSGWDVSVPYLLRFSVVRVLDEFGLPTGCRLRFIGAPGRSFCWTRLSGGHLELCGRLNEDVGPPLPTPNQPQSRRQKPQRSTKQRRSSRRKRASALRVGLWRTTLLLASLGMLCAPALTLVNLKTFF